MFLSSFIMAQMLVLIVLVFITLMINIQCTHLTYYISQTGNDSIECGNITFPCGTIYYVTKLINNTDSGHFGEHNAININITTGQNSYFINKYITNRVDNYHPCLPIPIQWVPSIYIQIIQFYFNNLTMNQWFPSICHNIQYSVNNTHLFYFALTYINTHIYGLHVTDYIFDTKPHSILWSDRIIRCYQCIINNLIFNSTQREPEYNAVWQTNSASSAATYIYSSSFSNIIIYGSSSSVLHLISGNSVVIYPQNYPTDPACFFQDIFIDNGHMIQASGTIHIQWSYFINITIKNGFRMFEVRSDGMETAGPYFFLYNSQFINNTGIILYIYRPIPRDAGTQVVIHDNIIKTRLTLNDGFFWLFYIDSLNEANIISFLRNTFIYYYNLYENCYDLGVNNYTIVPFADVIDVICVNPIQLLSVQYANVINIAIMYLSMIYVSHDYQTVVTMDEYRESVAIKYGYNMNDIANQNVIISLEFERVSRMIYFVYVQVYINNLYVNGSFGNQFIYFLGNLDIIDINGLYINDNNKANIYNPNDLTSNVIAYIILTREFNLRNSYLSQCKDSCIVMTNVGNITILYTEIRDAFQAVTGDAAGMIIHYCWFYQLGNYFAPVQYYGINKTITTFSSNAPISVMECNNHLNCYYQKYIVEVTNSDLSYYSITGLLNVSGVDDVNIITIANNHFTIDVMEQTWYKNIATNMSFQENVYGVIQSI